VNDLEVAFQRDDHQTDLLCRQSCYHGSGAVEDETDRTVQDGAAAAVLQTVCQRQDVDEYSSGRRVKIHRRLVGDQRMDTAC